MSYLFQRIKFGLIAILFLLTTILFYPFKIIDRYKMILYIFKYGKEKITNENIDDIKKELTNGNMDIKCLECNTLVNNKNKLDIHQLINSGPHLYIEFSYQCRCPYTSNFSMKLMLSES